MITAEEEDIACLCIKGHDVLESESVVHLDFLIPHGEVLSKDPRIALCRSA